MLGLLDDLSQQSSGSSEVIILISQQILENHGQELQMQQYRSKDVMWGKKESVNNTSATFRVESDLWCLLWAVLQHGVQDLHVVGIPGVRQLIKYHQLHHGGQVVSVSIQQLPGE